MEPISVYDIPVTEQHIRERSSRTKDIPIRPPGPPEPLELAFGDYFQEQRDTWQCVDWGYVPHLYKVADVRELSIFIPNPNTYFRDEANTMKIGADESVIEWVKKFYNTKKREYADKIPPITIRATINHRTGEGVMTICEYSNPRRPIGF